MAKNGNTTTEYLDIAVGDEQVLKLLKAIDTALKKVYTDVAKIGEKSEDSAENVLGKIQLTMNKVNTLLMTAKSVERATSKAFQERLANKFPDLDREEKALNQLAEMRRQMRKAEAAEAAKKERSTAAQLDKEEAAVNRLADTRRRLRKAEAAEMERQQKAAAAALDKEETAVNRMAEMLRRMRKSEAVEAERNEKAALSALDKEETAINRMADAKRRLRKAAEAAAQKEELNAARLLDKEENAVNKMAELRRRMRKAEAAEAARVEKATQSRIDKEEAALNRLAEAQRKLRKQDAAEKARAEATVRQYDTRLAKMDIPGQVAVSVANIGELQTRANIEERIDAARNRYLAVGAADKKQAFEILQIERARLAELDKQTAAQSRKAEAGRVLSKSVDSALIPGQVAAAVQLAGAEEVRAIAAANVAKAHKNLLEAEIGEKAELRDILLLEQRRLREAEKYVQIQKRQEREANKNARAPAEEKMPHPLHFLPAGGAATVLARTAAYGLAGTAVFGVLNALRDGAAAILDFESGMKQLQAISGSTNGQMETLSKTVLGVARNTKFATNDLVESATVLAQAGQSTSEIAQSLQSIATLATASGSSLQQTTDIVTSALGAFQLGANETSRITDVLTTSLNTTKLNLTQVAQALQYAGQTAFDEGLRFEELIAAIAAMAQAGVKSGSTQGTGLRTFLTDLQSPSKKLTEELTKLGISMEEINVKTRGLPAVLETLSKKGFDSASAFASMEMRSAAAYLVLKNQIPTIYEQIEAQATMGRTMEANIKAMDSFESQWQRFKNILVGNFVEGSEGPLGWLTNKLREANDLIEKNILVEQKRQQLMRSRGFENPNGQEVLGGSGFLTVYKSSRQFQQAQIDVNKELEVYGDRLTAAKQLAYEFAVSSDEARTELEKAKEEYSASEQRLFSYDQAVAGLRLRHAELKDGSVALRAETLNLSSRFIGLTDNISGTIRTVNDLIAAFDRLSAAETGAMMASADRVIAASTNMIQQNNRLSYDAVKQMQGYSTAELPNNVRLAVKNYYNNPNDYRSAGTIRAFQDSLLRKNVNDPLANVIGTFMSGVAGRIENTQNVRNTRRARDAQNFLRTDPSGVELSRRVEAARGGSNSEKQNLMAELDRQFRAQKTEVGKNAVAYLQQRLSSSITSDAPRAALPSASGGGSRSAANSAARNETFTAKEELGVIEDELRNSIDDAKKDVSSEAARASLAVTQYLLDEWVAKTREVAQAEMVQKGIDPNSDIGQRLKQKTEREIQQKINEVSNGLTDAFIASIEKQLETIDRDFAKNIFNSEENLRYLQGRLSGLDRYSLRNDVTEGSRILAQANVSREQEKVDAARGPIIDQALAEKQGLLNELVKRQMETDAKIKSGNGSNQLALDLSALNTEIEKVKQSMQELVGEKASLDAAFTAGLELPRTFGENLRTAASAYIEANNLNRTFTQELNQNLYGAIGNLHGSFNTLFTDLTSGTMSVGSAFRNMTLNVLKSLQQLAAQMVANKLFGMLLSLVGGAAFPKLDIAGSLGAPMSVPEMQLTPGTNYFGNYNGGKVGYLGGGKVANGSIGFDSVNAKLAKEEWVINRSAAKSVGDDFMSDLNRRGAAALKGLKGPSMLAMSKPSMTNVYVVAPEHKQQMGPSDVLLVLQDDILRNGQTKQLIKSVAAGA